MELGMAGNNHSKNHAVKIDKQLAHGWAERMLGGEVFV
jgi:hypothetical protein